MRRRVGGGILWPGPGYHIPGLGVVGKGRPVLHGAERAAEGQGQNWRVPLWDMSFKKMSISSDFFDPPVGLLLFLFCLHMFFGLLVGSFPDGIPQVVGEGIRFVSY